MSDTMICFLPTFRNRLVISCTLALLLPLPSSHTAGKQRHAFMKVRPFLFVSSIASMTKNRHSLVQPIGKVEKACYKSKVEMQFPTTEFSEIKSVKTEAKMKNAVKVWDLETVQRECIHFHDAGEFETWLSSNYNHEPAVWVKVAKKSSGIPSVTYKEALLVALCYGWIDGIKKSLDESFFLQRFTPRRTKSNWSLVNKTLAAELIESGRMQESGLKAISDAKEDGRWYQNNG